jgi:cob(I)alamin adenosyltransferase
MKIYTCTGDKGETGLVGGTRVSKNHPRLAAFGTVDELNAHLGLCRAGGLPSAIDAVVARLQHELFALGAELATPEGAKASVALISEPQVAELERDIDAFDGRLAPLSQFILPGGAPVAAALHVARCVCRRAERELVSLAASTNIRPETIKYLNRVGDLLFVLARAANAEQGSPDVPWQKPT